MIALLFNYLYVLVFSLGVASAMLELERHVHISSVHPNSSEACVQHDGTHARDLVQTCERCAAYTVVQ